MCGDFLEKPDSRIDPLVEHIDMEMLVRAVNAAVFQRVAHRNARQTELLLEDGDDGNRTASALVDDLVRPVQLERLAERLDDGAVDLNADGITFAQLFELDMHRLWGDFTDVVAYEIVDFLGRLIGNQLILVRARAGITVLNPSPV